MSYFRKEYIQQKIEVPKNCLSEKYCITLKPAGFGYFDKYHEMHPLVLSFCKQAWAGGWAYMVTNDAAGYVA